MKQGGEEDVRTVSTSNWMEGGNYKMLDPHNWQLISTNFSMRASVH